MLRTGHANKREKPGKQERSSCSSGWEMEGCRGVRREGAEMCSGGALSLFVEKVSRLCPVLLDAYQQVIGHGHTQELFAFFLSHLSFCRCHTSGAGFGRSHLSLLKSHLNQNKSTMSGMGQHKHKAIPIKQQREGVHFRGSIPSFLRAPTQSQLKPMEGSLGFGPTSFPHNCTIFPVLSH